MVKNLQLECEETISLRRLQGKRMLADRRSCLIDLKIDGTKLFTAFDDALSKVNSILNSFPPQTRSRNLEASVMQSCFTETLFAHFPSQAFFGKYKRLILRINGYVLLFKKLNNQGYPMNIKTINVQSILNQNQVLDLFSYSNYKEDPIIYFGYQKNRLGEILSPQIIYIDEGEIKFSLNEFDFDYKPQLKDILTQNLNSIEEVKPRLKNKQNISKIN